MNRTEKLRAIRNPETPEHTAFSEVLGRVQMIKGDKGDDGNTPVRGVDYFTKKDIDSFVNILKSLVKDGYTPVKGVDYTDGAPGAPGRDGITPETLVRGVHYWTPEDKKEIVKQAAKLAKGKDGQSPKLSEIVPAVLREMEGSIEYGSIKNAPDLSSLPELIDFLRRGGFRGGGSSGGSTGNTTQTADLSSQCNGTNKIFTLPTSGTTVLSLIGSDAPIIYRPSVDFVLTGTTITLQGTVFAPSAGATLIATYI